MIYLTERRKEQWRLLFLFVITYYLVNDVDRMSQSIAILRKRHITHHPKEDWIVLILVELWSQSEANAATVQLHTMIRLSSVRSLAALYHVHIISEMHMPERCWSASRSVHTIGHLHILLSSTNYSLNHYIHSIKYLLNTIDSSNLLTRISLHLEVFLSVWPIRSSGKIQPCLFNQCRSPRMDISIHPHQLHPKEMHHQQDWESNLKELSQPKALIRLKPLLAPLIASIHQTTRRQLLLLSRQCLSMRSKGTSFPKMRRNI